nr:Asp-tRNA(Asn)/Glu-tRNA(Gln) amidotransferase subunit GatC [Chryseomicrobium aureum]
MEVSIVATITKEEVRHVAHLARLAITDEEVEHFTEQLAKIVQFADKLNELDTTNVEPTTHVLPLENVLREDKSIAGLDREVMMKNVKDQEAGQVKVPAIMD